MTKEEAIRELRTEYLSITNDITKLTINNYTMSVLDDRLNAIKTTLQEKYGVNAR